MSIAVTKLAFNQTAVPATMVASATVMMAATTMSTGMTKKIGWESFASTFLTVTRNLPVTSSES